MAIIVARPPNFEQILAAFPDAAKLGVIFAYGPDVYSPSGLSIAPALLAHESVHCERQRSDPQYWWNSYIADAKFRYAEELLAHVAEFQAQRFSDRNQYAKLLMFTAARLVAPLYHYIPPRSLLQAVRDLEQELGL
jgi:hypothetical protein